MLLTFPHMGKLYLALTETCRQLGILFVLPSFPGPHTLLCGQELAPEGSCLPFSLVLGNMREGLEKGADTVIMLGGSGPCRFGYFVYLAEKILRDAGYSFRMLALDRGCLLQDYRELKKAAGCSPLELLHALNWGWQKMSCQEELDRVRREYLPAVQNPRDLAAAVAGWEADLSRCQKPGEIKRLRVQMDRQLAYSALRPSPDVLRVGLVGDIYTLLEPFASCGLEDLLLSRGVSIHKEMAVSRWLPNAFLPWRRGAYFGGLLRWARPYLRDTVGGFGLESVAHGRKMSWGEVDGVIQVFPLGCMPEIVARSALNKMAQEEQVPLLSMTLDQHEGHLGLETRVEAFLEMVCARKAAACR